VTASDIIVRQVQAPETHQVHVKLENGEEALVPCWLDNNGLIHVPTKLSLAAVWVYDCDARKVLKNKTGRSFLVPLGVKEVDRSWLVIHGFVRIRRPVLQPTADLR